MTDDTLALSATEIDYLRELVNIGTGNAAGALSFILRHPVETKIPKVRIGRLSEIAALFGHEGTPLAGIRLALTGDIKGSLTFFLAERHRRRLAEMARDRTGAGKQGSDDTILVLVAQAVATSNLDAIKRFCGLDIRHSQPVLETNFLAASPDDLQALLIETTYVIDNNNLRTYMLMAADRESLQTLISSITYVTEKLFGAG